MSNNRQVPQLPALLVLTSVAGVGLAVVGAVALLLMLSLIFLVTGGRESPYEQIGRGGMAHAADSGGAPAGPAPGSPAARAEQEQEIRQMLSARSERLVRRGHAPLDLDAEVSRLLEQSEGAADEDPGLQEEVRQLVLARNERRVRQGLQPLDVEAEMTRTLQELDP